jgi:hypothetical protein
MKRNLKNLEKQMKRYSYQNIKNVTNQLNIRSNDLTNTWINLSKGIQNNILLSEEILIDKDIIKSKKKELNYISDFKLNDNYIKIIKGFIERENLLKKLSNKLYEKEINLHLKSLIIDWIMNDKKGNIQKILKSYYSKKKVSRNKNNDYYIYSNFFLESNKNILKKIRNNRFKINKNYNNHNKSLSEHKKKINFCDLNLSISNFPFHYFFNNQKSNSEIKKTMKIFKEKNTRKKKEIFIFHNIKDEVFFKTNSYFKNKYNLYYQKLLIHEFKKPLLTLQDKENITFIIKKKKNKSCPKGNSRYM